MKKIIHHIRKQTEEVKRHILHVTIMACGVVLILLWVFTLGTTLTSPDTQAKMSQDLKPLSALKDNMISGYNSIILTPDSNAQE